MVASSLPWFTVELDPFPNVEESFLSSSPRTIQAGRCNLDPWCPRNLSELIRGRGYLRDMWPGFCERIFAVSDPVMARTELSMLGPSKVRFTPQNKPGSA